MADDPFDAPNAKPPARVARPDEPLWTEQIDHVTSSAILRYHGKWGLEARILRDGDLVMGRRFDTRALAMQWADSERSDLRAVGWAGPKDAERTLKPIEAAPPMRDNGLIVSGVRNKAVVARRASGGMAPGAPLRDRCPRQRPSSDPQTQRGPGRCRHDHLSVWPDCADRQRPPRVSMWFAATTI